MSSKSGKTSNRRPWIFWVLFTIAAVITTIGYINPPLVQPPEVTEKEVRKEISAALGDSFKKNQLPTETEIVWNGNSEKVKVIYSLDSEMQEQADWLLRNYRPDYSTIVAMDASTGKILAMASYEGENPSHENWALKATFPAASIFKMVTAAAAIEKYAVSPDLEISYLGSNYKMYKKNLFNTAENHRWARTISLREAFARSINIFFGKLTLQFMQPHDLIEYADKFKFNSLLPADMPVDTSHAVLDVGDPYQVAEVASGFNDINTLSPLHGAALAAAVANDGVMKAPYIVDRMVSDRGELLYQSSPVVAATPVQVKTAEKLRLLMQETVDAGTSRKSFKELKRARKFAEIELGGKTGSLTGENPKGKTDWFVGYGRYQGNVIAVAAVTVNKKVWRVKSAYLGQRMIREFFEGKFKAEAEAKRNMASEKR